MNTTPEQGARLLTGTVLCVLATWASLLSLRGLVDGQRWFVVACVAVLVVAAATALARAASRRWWVPTAVGGTVALVGIVLRYGAPPGRPQFLPDLDALGRAWATAQQGLVVIQESYVPMPDVRAGEMLLVLAALAVYLLVDAAVLALRFTAVSGLPLLALWLPAVGLRFPAGASPMFWTAVAYLALLAYGSAPLHAHAGRSRRAGTAAVAAAALAAGSMLAGPPLTSLPGWASIGLPTFGDGPVGPLELSDDLDLRESLGTRSSQVVLRYRVSDPTADPATEGEELPAAAPDDAATPATRPVDARLVGPLRAFTMATFDGRLWERTENEELEPWEPDLLLSSDPAVRGSAPVPGPGALAQVDLQVEGLRERRLPVSTFPRTVDVDGRWRYDPSRDEVVGDRATGNGLTYSMLVQVPALTKGDLAGAGAGTPPDPELYTTVPTTAHQDDIAALAAEITADAEGPYRQALDLQTWLRSAANFTYDTRVPPARSSDAVWDFLEDRRGYCVQFATAMAMMARTLDIPSRIGVGFLPGERTDDGSYVVTGRLAHAWPELYFEGQGWVRFEPTPATQSGPPPVWADPFSGISAPDQLPGEIEANAPGAVPSSAPTAPALAAPVVEDEAPWWTSPIMLALALVVPLGTAAVVAVLLARRRRRRAAGTEEAWTALRRELARAGVRWSDATTPRGVVRHVQDAVAARGGTGLDVPTHDALESLARAVERSRYAPTPVVHDATELDTWVQAAGSGVRAALAREAEPTVLAKV